MPSAALANSVFAVALALGIRAQGTGRIFFRVRRSPGRVLAEDIVAADVHEPRAAAIAVAGDVRWTVDVDLASDLRFVLRLVDEVVGGRIDDAVRPSRRQCRLDAGGIRDLDVGV